MNFRNIALVAALVSVAGVASAQSFELKAGAGASLSGNTFTVGAGQFSVEVWFNGNNQAAANSLILSLAYDSTNSTAGNANPTRNEGKLDALGGYQTLAAALPAWSAETLAAYTGLITSGMTTARPGGAPLAGNNMGSTSGARPVVWYVSRTGGTGTLPNSFKVATFTFTHSIAAGDTYGDSESENGLYVYDTGSTSTSVSGGSSGVSGPGGSNFGSMKYRVTNAVPEPTTMAALGLGLAAIARRRRNKK